MVYAGFKDEWQIADEMNVWECDGLFLSEFVVNW